MYNTHEEKSSHPLTGTTLTLQSLIDARYDINRNLSSTSMGGTRFPGQRTAQRRGQGMEFIDLRQYNQGDDVRHIDWNVTARSNEPYTRLFREEREQITTVIVDLRPLMFTGSTCLRAVGAAQLAARVLWQACECGDRCAAMVVSTEGITISRPGAGNKGVLRALELIASGFASSEETIRTGYAPSNAKPLLSDTLKMINANRRSSGRYFLLSGIDIKDDPQWPELLPVTAVTGQLKAMLLLDRLEQQSLPSGRYRFQSSRGPKTTILGSNNTEKYTQELQQDVQTRSQLLADHNIDFLIVPTTVKPAEFLLTLQQEGWL